MSLRDSIERHAAAADPKRLEVGQLQKAHDLGRAIATGVLTGAPLAGAGFDAATTVQGVEEFKGRLAEMNPLLPDPAKTPWQFLAVKAAIGGVMSLSVYLLRKHHRDREAAIASVLGTAAGVVPAMLNRASIAREREKDLQEGALGR